MKIEIDRIGGGAEDEGSPCQHCLTSPALRLTVWTGRRVIMQQQSFIFFIRRCSSRLTGIRERWANQLSPVRRGGCLRPVTSKAQRGRTHCLCNVIKTDDTHWLIIICRSHTNDWSMGLFFWLLNIDSVLKLFFSAGSTLVMTHFWT